MPLLLLCACALGHQGRASPPEIRRPIPDLATGRDAAAPSLAERAERAARGSAPGRCFGRCGGPENGAGGALQAAAFASSGAAPERWLEAPAASPAPSPRWRALLSLALASLAALGLRRIIAGALPAPATARGLTAQLGEAQVRARAADDQLRLVSDNVPAAVAMCDAGGRLTFANRHFLARHGSRDAQVVGKPLREVVGEEIYAAIERYLAECLAGHELEGQFEVAGPGGQPMVLHAQFKPVRRDGRVAGLYGTASDVTRLKRAEQRLRASRIGFRQLVDNAPFGLYVVDSDFRIVEASISARKAFESHRPGANLLEVLHRTWPEAFASEAIARFRHTLATGEPHHDPGFVERRKDTGTLEAYDFRLERLILADGRCGVVCHFYDLSERMRYEEALRESEAAFRLMFYDSAVGKIEIELETGRFLRANAAMCRLVGYSESELLNMTVFDITHPDDRDHDRASLRNLDALTLPVFDREKRYVRKDGRIVWARVTANPVRNSAGRPMRNIAVVQDINERKKAELELEVSKTRLQLALDAARLGWFQYDPLHGVLSGDARFREILDLDPGEIAFGELLKRIAPNDREQAAKGLAAALDPANPQAAIVEYHVRRRSGGVRRVETQAVADFEGEGPGRRAVLLVGTAQDITERKQHEEQTQLLMREVNHRAKNMLSVVDAIAHQTAARNPEDFLDRFSKRIQALSAIQDLLVRNDWKGVGVAELVVAHLAEFADLVGSRIFIGGPALRLSAAAAQAIGLALHELSTNAGEYGALSTDEGSVKVLWWIAGNGFHMTWTERNGPRVELPQRRGFGTVVMGPMVERTVSGRVALDYGADGMSWRLRCPPQGALEGTA